MGPSLGKILILFGLFLTAIGLLVTFLPAVKLGRLPGDITISVRNGKIYIPLATCLLLSVILSLIFWLISYLRR